MYPLDFHSFYKEVYIEGKSENKNIFKIRPSPVKFDKLLKNFISDQGINPDDNNPKFEMSEEKFNQLLFKDL